MSMSDYQIGRALVMDLIGGSIKMEMPSVVKPKEE